MMQITVLDGQAINPGDLSWKPFESLGNFKLYPFCSQENAVKQIGESEIILLNKVQITKEIIDSCPSLKYIGVQATGFNNIDLDAARSHGITVTNVPSYSTMAVAQMTFSYILNWACLVNQHNDSVHNGEWISSPSFCYWKSPLTELDGKNLGIFGYGTIGKQVARIARSFGMNVLACSRSKKEDVEQVDFETLLKKSDFLTFHCPLTPETKDIINIQNIKKMKPSAYIINTARGACAVEEDIRQALHQQLIAGYATDVLRSEPMSPDCPLYRCPGAIITPHVAWAPKETRQRCVDIVLENLKSWLEGHPQNVVS